MKTNLPYNSPMLGPRPRHISETEWLARQIDPAAFEPYADSYMVYFRNMAFELAEKELGIEPSLTLDQIYCT